MAKNPVNSIIKPTEIQINVKLVAGEQFSSFVRNAIERNISRENIIAKVKSDTISLVMTYLEGEKWDGINQIISDEVTKMIEKH